LSIAERSKKREVARLRYGEAEITLYLLKTGLLAGEFLIFGAGAVCFASPGQREKSRRYLRY
jgi:hypothetical protein